MKKLSKKYTTPLFMSMMLPTMLFGTPAVILLKNLPENAPFFESWISIIKSNTPITFIYMLCSAILIRTLVSKVLTE